MRIFKKQLKQGWLLAGLLPLMISCQTMDLSEIKTVDWHCTAYLPITWSQQDTVETIHQIKQHNAVWFELCN